MALERRAQRLRRRRRRSGDEWKRLTFHHDHDANSSPERRQFLLKLAIFRNESLHTLAHLQQGVRNLFKPFCCQVHNVAPFQLPGPIYPQPCQD